MDVLMHAYPQTVYCTGHCLHDIISLRQVNNFLRLLSCGFLDNKDAMSIKPLLVTAFFQLLILGPYQAFSRSWTDVDLLHNSDQQFHVGVLKFEVDPFSTKRRIPTKSPSPSPEEARPSDPKPTRVPFDGDEKPPGNTAAPATNLTDSERFFESPVPQNPPRGYFNYDIRDSSLYGPGYPAMIRDDDGFKIVYQNNAWKFVQNPNNFYWREFTNNGFGAWSGSLATRDFSENQCGNVGMQSPIDIRLSGVACVEHHQIRTLPGDFRVSGSAVEKRIEPNKLRLVWQRRPCSDLMDSRCEEPDPPHADFPNGWGGFADAMHVDFKVPSEHRIYGEGFDGEMQIFHLHPGRKRLPTVSVLIRAEPGGHNDYLQAAIDAFQHESDLHHAECASKMRNNRQLVTDFHRNIMGEAATDKLSEDYDSWAKYSTLLDDPQFLERGKEYERKLTSGIWSPYHPDLMPTFWFYGYDGSLTEPPCTEIVSWFVMDTPMTISPEQLDQMKTILFTNVDSNCTPISAHFNGSVARPIQESAGRQVWQCTRDDYIPDAERNNS